MLLQLEISEELKQRLETAKEQTGMSMALMVRRMIELHLETGAPLQFNLLPETEKS